MGPRATGISGKQRVKPSNPFVADDASLASRALRVSRQLPPLGGAPIRLGRMRGLRGRYGDSHAVTYLRQRRILFDCAQAEFPRIFVHELFHFVWLRAGNGARNSFALLLEKEMESGARGELGWSSELRKLRLTASDRRDRTRPWRDYCCESFCDTAAWLFSGITRHNEFTLAKSCRKNRREWFARTLDCTELPI
jgi:hypothetical protein